MLVFLPLFSILFVGPTALCAYRTRFPGRATMSQSTCRRTLLTAIVMIALFGNLAEAQININSTGVPFTQNFDALVNTPATGNTWTDNTTLPGWYSTRVTYNAATGSSNTGALYSFGAAAATERALGGIASGGTGQFFWAARLVNGTGGAITSVDISYVGEQWRDGGAAVPVAQTTFFEFQVANAGVITDADTPTTGWTAFPSLNFVSPTFVNTGAGAAIDGNLAANRTALMANLAVAVAAGQELWIRWRDPNDGGNDHGLSIDDFSVTANGGAPAINLSINDVTQVEGDAGTTNFNFTVSLSAMAGPGGVTFDIMTADNSATTADNDYVMNTLVGQTIGAGNTTFGFTVMVNGDTTVEPNQSFFVDVTNVMGATVIDGQGLGTITNDDVSLTPIHDIQGPGSSSPLVSTVVSTRGIVTGVKSNGFFIQEPDATADADPLTSEGILVFVGAAPAGTIAVGDLVQVTGTVLEFVPSQDPLQPPLTELGNPGLVILELSAGNPLPTPVALTAMFPDAAGAFDQLERHEGMRVSVMSLTVGGPTLGNVNEPNATATSTGVYYGVVTGNARAFREEGIQAPDPPPSGTIPPIPRFDTNPEVIRVDSDSIVGMAAVDVNTGATVTNLIGPLDYSFRHYTIAPTAADAPSGGMSPIAATVPTADEFTVAAYNLERFFDTVNDPGIGEPVLTTTAFNNRLQKASRQIRNYLHFPDILGVVECENLTTLQALATQISTDAIANTQPDPLYLAFLVEGNDVGGIDVGFLVKTSIVFGATPRVTVVSVSQELDSTLFVNPDMSTETLNDRPPLLLDAIINHPNGASFPIVVIVNHLRSLIGVADPGAGSSGWPTAGERVRAKRHAQAVDLATLVQNRQIADPNENIILVGDFNAFEFNDGYGDSMNVIGGTPPPDNQTVVPGDGIDLVNPDLDNLFDTAPAIEHYSFVFDGNAQSLDHVLANTDLLANTTGARLEHPRVNADFAEIVRNNTTGDARLADHDPVVAYFTVPGFQTADLELVKSDGPDPVSPGANLTYSITITNNGPGDATNPSFSDPLPVGTTFVSITPEAGWTCATPMVGANGTVDCDFTTLANGAVATFTIVVQVDIGLAPATILSNTATADSDTADDTPGNDADTETTTVGTGSAALSLDKTEDVDPVAPGNNLVYTLTISNEGPSNADTVSWSDPLPVGTTFVSFTQPGGWTCMTPTVGTNGTVTCSIASLAPSTAVFTITVLVDALLPGGTILDNTATVTSVTPDPQPGDETDTELTTVGAGSADVSVTVSDAPDPVDGGSNVVYTVTASLTAAIVDATDVSVVLPAPPNATFQALTSPGGWSCMTPAIGTNGLVSCSIASLPASVNEVFSLTLAAPTNVPPLTMISQSATFEITSSGRQLVDSDTEDTTVRSPANLSATKTVAGDTWVGGNVTYTVVITNNGPSTQFDNPTDEFTDTLPAELELVSVNATSGTATADTVNDVVTWNGILAPAASVTITIQATLASGTVGATVSNQGAVAFDSTGVGTNTAAGPTDDPGVGGGTDPTNFTITSPATLSAVKFVSGGTLRAGGTVIYTIEIFNAGPAAQLDNPGDELTDILPPELILVSASASSGMATANLGTNTVTWNGTIAANATVTISINAEIADGLAIGTQILNQATLAFDADGNGSNEASTPSDDPDTAPGGDATVFGIQGSIVEVPTLGQMGQLLMAVLLAMAALIVLRRR
jgi:uncharacterized protein